MGCQMAAVIYMSNKLLILQLLHGQVSDLKFKNGALHIKRIMTPSSSISPRSSHNFEELSPYSFNNSKVLLSGVAVSAAECVGPFFKTSSTDRLMEKHL